MRDIIFLRLKDITRFLRANLSFFFNKKENFYSSLDLQILEEINKYHSKLLLTKKYKLHTHNVFSKKVLKLIINKNLLNFLQLGYIQQMFFIHNRFFIIYELMKLVNHKKWKLWKKLIKENDIGNPVRFFLYPYTSGNKIHQVNHLKEFSSFSKINLSEHVNVVEFGGGYGNMASIFSKINRRINYIIFDTQEVGMLQYYYLKKCKLDVGFGIKNKNKIKLIYNIKDLRKAVKNFKNNQNNLFISNWSISEVPLKFRDKFNFIFKKFNYQIFSFQSKFEKINNLKYFNNLYSIYKLKKRRSIMYEMSGKKENFYLFSSK